ncbi:MAG TPA: L-threonylcarbamoyladenylate synthase [Rubricoccaceae bacterium]|nr:L-threonylcarbamoyladenylate synthase [Rubricoccaceae bacterium]
MSAPVVGTDAAGVREAAAVVARGGVLLYPTETVYGLGGDAFAAGALDRVRALKGRDAGRPVLALTDDWARVAAWLAGLTDVHDRLMAAGAPLTILFEAGPGAPPGLVGPEGLVGVRRTTDPFCRAVIATCQTPLVSTSANPAGAPPPVAFADVDVRLLDAVDLAVDAGAPLAGVPSTVVRVVDGEAVVLREGAVDAATVRRIAAGRVG